MYINRGLRMMLCMSELRAIGERRYYHTAACHPCKRITDAEGIDYSLSKRFLRFKMVTMFRGKIVFRPATNLSCNVAIYHPAPNEHLRPMGRRKPEGIHRYSLRRKRLRNVVRYTDMQAVRSLYHPAPCFLGACGISSVCSTLQ